MGQLLHAVRTGAFVTPSRMHLWATALLVGYAAAIVFLVLSAHGLSDYDGRPLGSDFSNIYSAGIEANAGHAAEIYDPPKHYAAEQAIFGAKTPFYGWHYPPLLLLIAAPLAHLPYLGALLAWQVVTFLLYLGSVALLLRQAGVKVATRSWLLFAAAYPAVFANILAAHNGFLTAALLGGGLASLDRRPLIAGLCFGLLAYKPQFGLMIPLVLFATGRWRTIATAVLTVAGLSILCTTVFGLDIWSGFLGSEQFTRTVVLEQGNTGFYKIQSIFAWVRMWGGPIPLAYGVQGLVTLASAIGLLFLWRGPASAEIKGAALCIAAVLATPYSLDYDLMALAPAIVLLAAQGLARGFGPYEKCAIAALWLAPFLARAVPAYTFIPVACPAMLACFLLALRHAGAAAWAPAQQT